MRTKKIHCSSIISTILEDWDSNSFHAFVILLRYRLLAICNIDIFFILVVKIFFHLINIALNINCIISPNAIIGRRVKLLHRGNGVVISGNSIIGNDVTIYHQVTIGVSERKKNDVKLEIGDKVVICAGAKVISCSVGNCSIIHPNAVVDKNIPPNSRVLSPNSIVSPIFSDNSHNQSLKGAGNE